MVNDFRDMTLETAEIEMANLQADLTYFEELLASTEHDIDQLAQHIASLQPKARKVKTARKVNTKRNRRSTR